MGLGEGLGLGLCLEGEGEVQKEHFVHAMYFVQRDESGVTRCLETWVFFSAVMWLVADAHPPTNPPSSHPRIHTYTPTDTHKTFVP